MTIQKLTHNTPATAKEILQLQKTAYAIEAELIGFSDLPPIKNTVDSIMHSEEQFIGYIEDHKILGVLSYKEEEGFIDIHRLMVNPSSFRKGIAQALLSYLFENSSPSPYPFIVQTGTQNTPAINLYEKNHFQTVQEIEIEPDVHMVLLRREI